MDITLKLGKKFLALQKDKQDKELFERGFFATIHHTVVNAKPGETISVRRPRDFND